MKTVKKLLCTLVALTLVFCSLGSVMTAGAKELTRNQKNCLKAFSSITIGEGEYKGSVPLEQFPDATEVLLPDTVEIKVKVKLKKGWKLKKMSYYDVGTGTTTKVKNGGKFPVSSTPESYLSIKAVNKKKTATYKLYAFMP